MKPKQWLADNGHIDQSAVNKRGRMSAAHVALIKEAVASGVHIEGYSVSKPAVETAKPSAEVTRVSNDSSRVADVPDEVRRAEDWEAYDDTGTRLAVGIKGVCGNCRSSFTYCRCKYPVANVDANRVSVVTFKPRKGGK